MQILIAVFAVLFTLSGCATTQSATFSEESKYPATQDDAGPGSRAYQQKAESEDSQEKRDERLYEMAEVAGVLWLDNRVELNRKVQRDFLCDEPELIILTNAEVTDHMRRVVAATPRLGKRPELAAYFLVKRYAESVVCGKKNDPKAVAAGRDIIRRIGHVSLPVLSESDPEDARGIWVVIVH